MSLVKTKSKNKMNFTVMGNKGLHFKVGGYIFSIQIGGANYCDNYDKRPGYERDEYSVESNNAEVTVWDKDGEWATREFFEAEDDVKGYVGPEEILDAMNKARNNEIQRTNNKT